MKKAVLMLVLVALLVSACATQVENLHRRRTRDRPLHRWEPHHDQHDAAAPHRTSPWQRLTMSPLPTPLESPVNADG